MRIIVTSLAAVALAACSAQPGTNNQAAAPAPALNAATGNTADDEASGLTAFRAQWLEACIGGGRDAAPPGTPVDRHCACAIDRVMAGKTLAQIEEERASGAYRPLFSAEMRRCIREIPS